MILRLDAERLRALDDVPAFLGGAIRWAFARWIGARPTRSSDACWCGSAMRICPRRERPGEGVLGKVTGLSRAQLTRLIGQHARTGKIEDWTCPALVDSLLLGREPHELSEIARFGTGRRRPVRAARFQSGREARGPPASTRAERHVERIQHQRGHQPRTHRPAHMGLCFGCERMNALD